MEVSLSVTNEYTRREFSLTTDTGASATGSYAVSSTGEVTDVQFQTPSGFGGSFDAGGSSSLWGIPDGGCAECGELADAVRAAALADEAGRGAADGADGSAEEPGDDGEAEAETA